MFSKRWSPLQIRGFSPSIKKKINNQIFPDLPMQAQSAGRSRPAWRTLQGRLVPDFCFSNLLLLAPWAAVGPNGLVSPPARNSQPRWFCSVSFGGPNLLERTRALWLFCQFPNKFLVLSLNTDLHYFHRACLFSS